MQVYRTQHLPGIGGRIRTRPEDFRVAEELERTASGRGPFAWIEVEKTHLSTPELLRRLGAKLGVKTALLGCAGYKDAAAVTRQWISLPWQDRQRLLHGAIPDVTVWRLERDHAPLRPELLASNRFDIVVRDVTVSAERALAAAQSIVAELERAGMPNLYGEQRFGVRGESAQVGRQLLRGQFAAAVDTVLGGPDPREGDPRARAFREAYERGDLPAARREIPGALRLESRLLDDLLAGASKDSVGRALPRQDARFYLSAWQALLFNRVVLARGLERIDQALPGDLLLDERDGEVLECRAPQDLQSAIREFVMSPTAPLFGTRVPLAAEEPGDIEREVLRVDLDGEAPRPPVGLALHGQRRVLRVLPRDVTVMALAPGAIRVTFALPAGSFATALLAEVMKTFAPPH